MTETPQKELDLRQMPIEAVAAYWLSLRKVMGPKVSPKTLQEEAANTAEPFIRYMLDLGLCGLDEATVRRAGERRRDTALRELGRKLGLMRDALLSMAAAENPRLALARMLARLPAPGQGEEGVTRLALDMVRFVEQGGAGTTLAVDTGLSAEELLVRLTFYVLWARREGKAAVWPLGGGSCRFFRPGSGPGFRRPRPQFRQNLPGYGLRRGPGRLSDQDGPVRGHGPGPARQGRLRGPVPSGPGLCALRRPWPTVPPPSAPGPCPPPRAARAWMPSWPVCWPTRASRAAPCRS